MKNREERPVIDSHIHFDLYPPDEQVQILADLQYYEVQALISVSFHLESCFKNLRLSQMDGRIRPAYGYHPEQPLPADEEINGILSFLKEHRQSMAAVGEVGLPYYLKQGNPDMDLAPYQELLHLFVQEAKSLDKPIILHAIYEDADTAISILERTSVHKAHFHWFKGSTKTLKRMKDNGYFISFTPDLLYDEEIMKAAVEYPLEKILVETDGPWKFQGPFEGKITHPSMIHQTMKKLAELKKEPLEDVYEIILYNTKTLYNI
ncbi:TatD family deoxyribonuclease [Bacillus salacetis]|uniref:TatD family deoxyribonuclease n=1 Tax=Bacillus salacetis TaxID=2315464 RepID=A0A3A1QT65_9BACI|nr:TatD family hydrolase [Bacillus salacetis]RIW30888.1 TatD family deoxyribonuclease [Bacillus salacetis]